jgi:hypothetical protein
LKKVTDAPQQLELFWYICSEKLFYILTS